MFVRLSKKQLYEKPFCVEGTNKANRPKVKI